MSGAEWAPGDVPTGWHGKFGWRTTHLLVPRRWTPTGDGSRQWHTWCGHRLDETVAIEAAELPHCGQCERRRAK